MNIRTDYKIKPLPNGKDAQLIIFTFIEDNLIGVGTALSGPKEDIEGYVAGEISWEEVVRRWNMNSAARERGPHGG